MMRHVYIRGILGLIWSVAAILGIVRGSMEMALFYALLGGLCLYSAYTVWKKEKDHD